MTRDFNFWKNLLTLIKFKKQNRETIGWMNFNDSKILYLFIQEKKRMTLILNDTFVTYEDFSLLCI